MVKTVFSVVVASRHFMADFFQWFKNLIGMRLTSYEDMISEATEKALYQLTKSYPNVYDIQITTSFVAVGTAAIICYGKVNVE